MIKGANKVITGVSLVTALVLIYVHQHVLLFQVSYDLDKKSTAYSRKVEGFRRLKFEVDQLKAPRLLEQQMRYMKLQLALPKEINIVRIPSSKAHIPIRVKELPTQSLTLSSRLSNFLGKWVDVAQAKVENSDEA